MMKRDRNFDTIKSYKEAKSIYSHEISAAKESDYEQMCTDAKNTSDTTKIVRALTNKQNNMGYLQKSDDTYTTNSEDTMELLMDTHFPNCVRITTLETEKVPDKPWIDKKHKTRIVKTKFISQIIKAFGSDKAAGEDNLTPRTLQHLPLCALEVLCQLYKCALANGYSPKVWRRMKVIFIPKAGKDSYETPKSFRPITLSNFVLKVMEKLIQRVITGNILDSPLDNQHGFTKGKSCESALSAVMSVLESATLKKKSALAVFLDISGAFDNVSFESVKNILLRRNIDPLIVNWYDHLLRNRLITSSIHDCSFSAQPTQGTPQGGVLSAVIWNLVNQRMLDKFNSGDVDPFGLADDTTLVTIKGSLIKMIERIQDALDKVIEWGKEEGLTFNATKTAAILFTKKHSIKTSTLPQLYMDGVHVPYVFETKYLGVIFTSNLSWHKHIQSKISACKRLLMLIRSTVAKEWGLSPDKIIWIWQTLVRPKLSYGAICWADPDTLKNTSICASLNKLQRLALSLVASSMKSTPTRSLELIFAIPPLHLFLEDCALNARLRTTEVVIPTWNGETKLKRKGHIMELDKTLKSIFPPEMTTDRTFKLNTCNVETYTSGLHDPDHSEINVYTDASVSNTIAGAGYEIMEGQVTLHQDSIHLGGDLTVFQAEALAIKYASDWLLSQNLNTNKNKINFYCDNLAIVKSLGFWSVSSKTLNLCIRSLILLSARFKVSIHWIPSHSGIEGNDMADILAKQGRISSTSDMIPLWPISKEVSKQKIRSHTNKKWQTLINSTSISHTKKFATKLNLSKAYKKTITQFSRTQLNTAVAWITGHCRLNFHLNRIGKVPDNKCRLCNTGLETPDHVLRFCPATKDTRMDMLFEYSNSKTKSKQFSWYLDNFNPTFKSDKISLKLVSYIINIDTETSKTLTHDRSA
jgi:ribonuclease HI